MNYYLLLFLEELYLLQGRDHAVPDNSSIFSDLD